MTLSPLQRRLLPFLIVQTSQATLITFGTVMVYAQGGMAVAMHYMMVLLTAVMLGVVMPYVVGRRWPVGVRGVARCAFALPALLLPLCAERPFLLAVAVGGSMGLAWAARHRIELGLIDDAERDGYAAHVTVIGVLVGLLTTLLASLALTWSDERRQVVLCLYAAVAAVGAIVAPQRLPLTAPMRLVDPLSVLRQPGYRASLPLYLLDSSLFGVGLVMGASGAIEALGKASHYGWAATLAALGGAFGLWVLRHRRHAENRDRTMAYACVGIVGAQLLLGLSAWLPALFVLHLVALSAVQPFWQASDQVLGQRAMDLRGEVVDRVALREVTLWVFRMALLIGFWLGVHTLSAHTVLALGALLMALTTALKYAVGRAWLRHVPGAVTTA